jgi:hypothetical protein
LMKNPSIKDYGAKLVVLHELVSVMKGSEQLAFGRLLR